MTREISVETLTGSDIENALADLAKLRITVFREWPYLYEGDFDYEQIYLKRFMQAARAVLIVAKDGDRIVGASTAAPLATETEEFRAPFERAGYELSKVFYFAESVLLPEYRGRGLGHAFFDAREAFARSFDSYEKLVFCGVVRPQDHPRRDKNYVPLDGFWRKRGFEKLEAITTTFSWKDIGEAEETEKVMQFWMKSL